MYKFATNMLYIVITTVFVMITSVMTLLLLMFSWKEIHHLHRTASQPSSGTKFALKYVSIVNITFMSMIFPVSTLSIICSVYSSKDIQPPESIIWIVVYSMITYGTVNCLIYAGMCDAYRETFVRVFIPIRSVRRRELLYVHRQLTFNRLMLPSECTQ